LGIVGAIVIPPTVKETAMGRMILTGSLLLALSASAMASQV